MFHARIMIDFCVDAAQLVLFKTLFYFRKAKTCEQKLHLLLNFI